MLDFDFSVEHVLMFMIAIFLLYHLVNNCGCIKDGFSVSNQSTNTCNKYDCGNNGILKPNASKILCPLNDKGISICDFNTCCDNIPINCDEALLRYCPFDGNINDQHSCIMCAGKNQSKLHNLLKSKNNWRCTHQDILDYCEPLPKDNRTFSVGWYQSGNILPNRCNGSINCPQGSTFIEKTTDGCTQIKWPIKSERTICELKDGALPTDEVIDVRKLNLIPGLTDDKRHKVSPSYLKNGKNWEYYYPNLLSNPSIILDTDPKIKILNMLYENFNFIRIGVNKGGNPPSDYTIVFENADGSTTKEGKHYNYTFIDNTGDNYDISTSYYGLGGKYLGYNSESPQINYIIKS